ncbi:glycosyltransferase [Polynucleobacter paneuropaeus]|nr:glycosyltransferase [Polynucleobacter paneuropaeus]
MILSIITVVKNDCERLFKTIASLEKYYDDLNYEHIIIDGVSTDLTLDLVHKVSSKINVKILSEQDDGIYDAMNKGIKLSRGKYLLFLNAGDLMLADNKELRSFIEAIPKNVDIACFPALMRDGDNSLPLMPGHFSRHKLPTSHQAMLFLRKFALLNLFNSRYKVAGDFDLYLRANIENLFSHPTVKFLTEVEREGYASNNPALAYIEYLKITCRRLRGVSRTVNFIRIAAWALMVIPAKKALSNKYIAKLRNLA